VLGGSGVPAGLIDAQLHDPGVHLVVEQAAVDPLLDLL
jgi:hypothetical protein